MTLKMATCDNVDNNKLKEDNNNIFINHNKKRQHHIEYCREYNKIHKEKLNEIKRKHYYENRDELLPKLRNKYHEKKNDYQKIDNHLMKKYIIEQNNGKKISEIIKDHNSNNEMQINRYSYTKMKQELLNNLLSDSE
jgi:hypothetical protein